jgi:hypothetical protein
MSGYEQTRTWTATIQVRTPRSGMVVLDATVSRWDLLRDQTDVAVREAAVLLEEGEVSVVLHKTTKARGTERDRLFTVYRDKRGVVRYDGPYYAGTGR